MAVLVLVFLVAIHIVVVEVLGALLARLGPRHGLGRECGVAPGLVDALQSAFSSVFDLVAKTLTLPRPRLAGRTRGCRLGHLGKVPRLLERSDLEVEVGLKTVAACLGGC